MKNPNNSQDIKKIILIGLDNAGKSSITLALQKHTNLMSFYTLKPTQGLNITDLRDETQQFKIWEYGGQKKYRDEYLEDLERYTEHADNIIFVIDVQDTARYKIALDYMEAIFKQLKNKDTDICIFLHKYDPGLEKVEHFSLERISTVLIKRMNDIIPSKYKFKIFKTSIYAVFQKSLLQEAFKD